ncbi:hypothetical protein D7Y21_20390 [Corallococcus sp. AB045]|uniref:type II toxin-antitoxin system MqsR family toxin n=1 Tax=Corallococcus sp. AB045 TaxID=2316719 RepID=UPI000EE69E77|nr:type II toxin-antitoxin system MqsR family toxin [Corallococcus sp. AB045]RKH86725.1 hypothetical protein D7Y21_20390 [Corallococcus sp. AB045]
MSSEEKYCLSDVRALFENSLGIITESATQGAWAQKFTPEDIKHVIMKELDASHFYKSMEADKCPGLWQDVYKLKFLEVPLYIKLQIRDGKRGRRAVVISFKLDESFR